VFRWCALCLNIGWPLPNLYHFTNAELNAWASINILHLVVIVHVECQLFVTILCIPVGYFDPLNDYKGPYSFGKFPVNPGLLITRKWRAWMNEKNTIGLLTCSASVLSWQWIWHYERYLTSQLDDCFTQTAILFMINNKRIGKQNYLCFIISFKSQLHASRINIENRDCVPQPRWV
jgi:hypothetical protein